MGKAIFCISLIFQVLLAFPREQLVVFPSLMSVNTHPDSYLNPRFWDEEAGFSFFRQETLNACVPAAIQMVLKYLDVSPLPSQAALAEEMHTNLSSTTEWKYIHIPFLNRRFPNYVIGSLTKDPRRALSYLKENITKNFPVIACTWYNEEAKREQKFTHARVVSGYNSTGIFYHDPLSGPNRFLNDSAFLDLWEAHWAIIIKEEPCFILQVAIIDLFGIPLSEVKVTLSDGLSVVEQTENGQVVFSNLTISKYMLTCDNGFETKQDEITLSRSMAKEYLMTTESNEKTMRIISFLIAIVPVIVFAIALYILWRKSRKERYRPW